MPESESGSPGASNPEPPSSAPLYKVAAVVVAGAGLVVGYVFVKAKPQAELEHAPAQLASSAPVPRTQCLEVEMIYRRMQASLACPYTSSGLAKAFCEMTYGQKQACIDEFESTVACIKAEPTSAWHCDAEGRLGLKETSCAAQTAAWRSCVQM